MRQVAEPRHRVSPWPAVGALVIAATMTLPARAQPLPGAATQPPAFRTDASLIVVEATIVDRQGKPLVNLAPSDLKVEIDGRPREIASITLVTPPPVTAASDADVSSNIDQQSGRTVLVVVDRASLSDQSRSVLESGRRWLRTLAPGDRVGVVALPQPALRVEPTTAHELVAEALGRIVPLDPPLLASGQRNVSLFEAIQIIDADTALRQQVIARECGVATSDISCPDEVDLTAQELSALATERAQSALTALQSLIEGLAALPGPKHVVLLTAGWAVPERFLASVIEPVAAAAAASHVIVHGVLADRSSLAASAVRMSPRPSADRELMLSSVELLTDWTGGGSMRVAGQGEAAYRALDAALAGYYRLGVRAEPADLDGKPHRIAIKTARAGLSVRGHRRLVSVGQGFNPAAQDPGSAAPGANPASAIAVRDALRRAVRAAAVSTDFGLRLTSYALSDAASEERFRIFVTGEVTGASPGPARLLAVLFDEGGRAAGTGEQAILVGDDGRAELGGSFPLPKGVYALRAAVRDATGRIASIERTVDTRWRSMDDVETTGLALFRVAGDGARPLPVLDAIATGDRLLLQVELRHDQALRPGAVPVLHVAVQREGDGAPLLQLTPSLARTGALVVAQETVPASVLPAGRYRIVVRTGTGSAPILERRVIVDPARASRAAADAMTMTIESRPGADPGVRPEAGGVPAHAAAGGGLAAFSALALARPAPFDPRTVLAPAFLDPLIARLAARPDVAGVREVLRPLAPETWPADPARGPLAASPVAAELVAGLARMRAGDLEAAASAFRAALRAAPDFTPVLFLLGGCYAAGGKDREAAGAWQTALLRERDASAVYGFAIDAWLRAENGVAALALARRARTQWPEDPALGRRHALAAFAAGEAHEGIRLVTDLGDRVDAPLLLMALASLYASGREASATWESGRDLATMRTLRERYAAQSGASLALVDAWIADLK